MVITESNVKRAVELLKVLINTPSLSREEGDPTDRLQMFIERRCSAKYTVTLTTSGW